MRSTRPEDTRFGKWYLRNEKNLRKVDTWSARLFWPVMLAIVVGFFFVMKNGFKEGGREVAVCRPLCPSFPFDGGTLAPEDIRPEEPGCDCKYRVRVGPSWRKP